MTNGMPFGYPMKEEGRKSEPDIIGGGDHAVV